MDSGAGALPGGLSAFCGGAFGAGRPTLPMPIVQDPNSSSHETWPKGYACGGNRAAAAAGGQVQGYSCCDCQHGGFPVSGGVAGPFAVWGGSGEPRAVGEQRERLLCTRLQVHGTQLRDSAPLQAQPQQGRERGNEGRSSPPGAFPWSFLLGRRAAAPRAHLQTLKVAGNLVDTVARPENISIGRDARPLEAKRLANVLGRVPQGDVWLWGRGAKGMEAGRQGE